MLKDTTGTSIGKIESRVLELCFQVEKRRGGCKIPSPLVRNNVKYKEYEKMNNEHRDIHICYSCNDVILTDRKYLKSQKDVDKNDIVYSVHVDNNYTPSRFYNFCNVCIKSFDREFYED